MCGGLGAWLGATSYDSTGKYDIAFIVMLVTAIAAVLLTVSLRPGDRQPTTVS